MSPTPNQRIEIGIHASGDRLQLATGHHKLERLQNETVEKTDYFDVTVTCTLRDRPELACYE